MAVCKAGMMACNKTLNLDPAQAAQIFSLKLVTAVTASICFALCCYM